MYVDMTKVNIWLSHINFRLTPHTLFITTVRVAGLGWSKSGRHKCTRLAAGTKHRSHGTGHRSQVIVLPIQNLNIHKS